MLRAASRPTRPPAPGPAHIVIFSADGMVEQNPAIVALICAAVGATIATPVPVTKVARVEA